MKSASIWVTLAAVVWVFAGCNTDRMLLTVKSPKDVNGGRPIRVLVRAVDPQEYVNETYQAVSDRVVVKDESVLYSGVVYPDKDLTALVRRTEKSMGVYFFFTAPGSRWKTLLELPLPTVTRIRLGANSIDSVRRD